MPATVSTTAPDFTLPDATGVPTSLSSLWEAAPKALALVFIRHFG